MIAWMILSSPVRADPIKVTINTSSLNGTSGKVGFDYTVNAPPAGQHVEILNFATDATSNGLPETQGGLVEGTLILPPFTTGAFTEIGSGAFFNELLVNLTFAKTITFGLEVPEYAPTGVPDQFSLFLLGLDGLPLFSTADPTGADALFAVDITGAPGGSRSAFAPATLTGDLLEIVTPGSESPVPEPATLSLVAIGCAGWIARHVRDRRKRSYNETWSALS